MGSGTIHAQPDFSVSQNDQGGWRGSRSYYMSEATWDLDATRLQFARGTSIGTADPDAPAYYSFLTIESVTPSYEPGELVRLTVNYTGAGNFQYDSATESGINSAALPVYRLDCRLRDLSITKHPKFAALTDEQKFALTGIIEGRYQASTTYLKAQYLVGEELRDIKNASGDVIEFSGDAQTFCQKIAEGETTYLAPTVSWTESVEGNSGLNNNQLNTLGKISTPRGNPPKASGTRDWMLTDVSQQQQGDLYRTTIEWQLSEKGGHDSFLYSD